MEERDLLLIPGPVSVEPEVLEAMARPVQAHYGPEWVQLYQRVVDGLRRVMHTEAEVFPIFASGSGAVEAGIATCLSPDDQILIVSTGWFGDRMQAISTACGLRVTRLRGQGYHPVDAGAVEAALEAAPGLRAIGIVHHETDLGLLNPVAEICAVARRRGLLTVVDAVSSLGGTELRVDAWGIDVCASVANKALAGPIGVAPVSVSAAGWAAAGDGRPRRPGWYLDLRNWRRHAAEGAAWHPHPTTMPTSVIEGLDAALTLIFETGLEAHLARQARAAVRVREGLRELGFEMLVDDSAASPVCTAALVPPGLDVPTYMTWMKERHRIRLGGGFNELGNRMVRVGHMGRAADPVVVDTFLDATAEYLRGARRQPPD